MAQTHYELSKVCILAVVALWGNCRPAVVVTDFVPLFKDFFAIKVSESVLFFVKINIDLIKTFQNLLTFHFINSVNSMQNI